MRKGNEKGRVNVRGKAPSKDGPRGVRVRRGELPPREIGRYRTKRVYYMGRGYDIPVDSDGKVPVEAMVMRFQELGNHGGDKGRDARIIYPKHATPDEIVRWWADPSRYDVQGIDTKRSDVYDVSGVKGKRMKAVQRRIGIVTPSAKEQARIRRILANAFTVEELEAMTKDRSFVIATMKDGGDVVGFYLRRADGQEVPLISIEEGATPDHVVHEAVHHLRTTRDKGDVTSTAFPQRADGKFDQRRYDSLTEAQKRRVHDAEETATAAEAVARTRRDPNPTGYYDYAGGREGYERDRELMASVCGGGDCTLKGAAAVRAVQRNYDKMNIAMASILGDEPAGRSAERIAAIQRSEASKNKTQPKRSTSQAKASGTKSAQTKASQSKPKTQTKASSGKTQTKAPAKKGTKSKGGSQ